MSAAAKNAGERRSPAFVSDLQRVVVTRMTELNIEGPADLARLSQLDRGDLSKIIGGKKGNLNGDKAVQLAAALQVPVESFYGRKPVAAAGAPAVVENRTGGAIKMIPLSRIKPSAFNPRRTFDDASLRELADSIAARGLLQNLVVLKAGDDKQHGLVAGERRYRAMQLLVKERKLPADHPVACQERDVPEAMARAEALLENLQREELPAIEEGEAFKALIEIDPQVWDTKTISETIGKSRRYVQQRLALATQLAPEARDMVAKGKLNIEQARALASAPINVQKEAAKKASVGHDWGIRPDQLERDAASRRFPVSRAKFDLKLYKGEIWEDADSETKFFADHTQAMRLQRKHADQMAEKLGQKWKWAEVHAGGYLPWGFQKASKAREKSHGAVVLIERTGKITVHTGLTKSENRSTAPTPAKKPDPEAVKKAEEEAAAREKENKELGRQLTAALAGDPIMALRYFAFTLCQQDAATVRVYGFGEVLPSLAAFPEIAQVVENDAGEVWAAIRSLPDAKVPALIAALLAGEIKIDEDYDGTVIDAALSAIAAEKKIDVPKHVGLMRE